MKNTKKLLSVICLVAILVSAFGIFSSKPIETKAMGVNEFLNTVGPMATADMQRTGILASLTMAQAILESGWGTSELSRNANALFGMKATNWSGATYWYNGTSWRAYGSWQESVSDHGNHLSTMSRYSNLVGETNYRSACYNVAADGYCPDAGYAENLISLIEKYNLTQFDVYSSLTLDGCGAVNLGDSFYANIRQKATGLYLTDRDYNVFAAEATNGADQLWRFTRNTNGSYTIGIEASGCNMDVAGGNYNNGTNIQTYPGNNSLAQKFFIYYISGNFYFKCTASDLLFDVDAATKNLQLFGTNSSHDNPGGLEHNARSFEIIMPCLSDGSWNVNYGEQFTAYIRNVSSGKLLTDVDNKIIGSDNNFAENQKWIITKNGYGGYEIKSAKTGKAFDISGAGIENGTSVQLYDANGSKAQTFFFIKRHSGLYIKPIYANSVVDMDAGTGELHIYGWADEEMQINAQVFELITERTENGSDPVNFGSSFDAYVISKSYGMAVTDTGSVPECQKVGYGKNQLWHFEYDEKWNAYKIIGSSGKVIDVSGAGWTDGVPLCMWESNDSAAQRFRIYVSDNGYYLSPACTSKIVDVDSNNKTLIHLWGTDVPDNRKFDIIKITKDGEKPLDLGSTFETSIKNVASSLYLNPTDHVVTAKKNEHKWIFTKQSNGSYVIKDSVSGKVFDVEGGNTRPGTNIQTYEYNGTWAQSFFIYKNSNGYILQPAKSHCVIDMDATSKEVHIYEINSSAAIVAAQTFDFPALSKGIELKSASTYEMKGEYIISVTNKTKVSDFVAQFNNSDLKVYNASGNMVSNSAYVATGYTVKSTNGDSKTIVVSCDLDGDGTISTTDSLRFKWFLMGKEDQSEMNKYAIDLDKNGICDTTDYLKFKGILLG